MQFDVTNGNMNLPFHLPISSLHFKPSVSSGSLYLAVQSASLALNKAVDHWDSWVRRMAVYKRFVDIAYEMILVVVVVRRDGSDDDSNGSGGVVA